MHAVWTLAMKDLRLLVRDRMALFWVLFFPLLMAFLFGAMFGGGGRKSKQDDDGPSGIPIALVDAERSAASADFAKRLEASKDVTVRRLPDVAAAKHDVLSGASAAYVALLGDFDGPGMFGGRPPRVEIGYAPSRRAESGMLRGVVLQTAANKLTEAFAPAGAASGGPAEPMMPAKIDALEVVAETDAAERPRPATNWEITFPSSILWGLIGAAATFALSLVRERHSGTFYRLKTAPLTRAQILAGKGLACFLACSFVAALLLSIGIFGLDVRVQNGPGLVLAALCSALCFTGIMMLLSTLGDSEQAASGMAWGIMTTMAMLGGGMVPLFVMPGWMQTASDVSPVKWGVLAIEGGIWRGFTLTDELRPCAVLVAIGVAGFVAGAHVLARRDG
jgi:ABC-2 type transport system permease protein